MAILTLGVSYRRAPIELLERLAFTDEDYAKAFRRADDLDGVDELTILSTCNRVELYAGVPSYHSGFLSLKRLLCESREVDPDEIAEPLYSHFDEHATEHLYAVASGLDSMVLGEQQIQSQVRDALKRAEAEGTAGPELTRLFHGATRTGRRVRTETALGAAPDAFMQAAAELAERGLGGLEGRRAVVVGAGQMAALAVKHLRGLGVGPIRILNRSLDHARALAERTSADHGDLDGLAEAIASADLVVSATGAAGFVIHASSVREALSSRTEVDHRGAGRAHRSLYLVDLAVPRDVDPDVATLEGVELVDIDSLKAFLAERDPGASAEIGRANEIVAEELRRFAVRRRSDRLAPLIRALRRRGEIVIAGELERFRSGLGDLTPDEREAVEGLARGIVSKLLHDPIVQLKERSTPGTDDTHAQLLAELFDVRPSSPVNPGGEE
jgi:glutamyl-tRNA reductase